MHKKQNCCKFMISQIKVQILIIMSLLQFHRLFILFLASAWRWINWFWCQKCHSENHKNANIRMKASHYHSRNENRFKNDWKTSFQVKFNNKSETRIQSIANILQTKILFYYTHKKNNNGIFVWKAFFPKK